MDSVSWVNMVDGPGILPVGYLLENSAEPSFTYLYGQVI